MCTNKLPNLAALSLAPAGPARCCLRHSVAARIKSKTTRGRWAPAGLTTTIPTTSTETSGEPLQPPGQSTANTLIADSLLRPPDSLLPAFPGAEEDSGLSKARSRPRARRVPLAAQALYHAPRTTQDPMVRIQSVPAATLLQPGSFASHLPSSTLPPPATRGAATTKLSEKHKKDARERERKEGKEGSEGVLQTVIKSAAAS